MNKPYYNVCPNCGAHLDPSERCDCMDKPIGSETNVIIRRSNDRLHYVSADKPIRRQRNACKCFVEYACMHGGRMDNAEVEGR